MDVACAVQVSLCVFTSFVHSDVPSFWVSFAVLCERIAREPMASAFFRPLQSGQVSYLVR